MGNQNLDRMKKTLSILMLVFVVVPLTSVAASAASGSGARGYGGHGDGGHGGNGNGGYGGWGPAFGYYPPAPYGDSGDSEVVCGPYGCYWNEATAYLPKLVLAEEAW